tara:strand:+ start:2831 stop:3481 length:651 start_codon:yes stop_codon:yes gene_type:complete
MLKKTVRWFFPNDIYRFYYEDLDYHLRDCKTVLDLACGKNSPIRKCKKHFSSTGVDIFEPYLKESQSKGIHDDYIISDVLQVHHKVTSKSFDAVIALDLIEHLEKDDGFRLIEIMEKVAIKKIILFTPNGFLKQTPYDDNPWQEHKSGWNISELKDKNFEVFAQGGLKYLRGERSKIKHRPYFFWSRISYITQKFVRYAPTLSYQILCVKNLEKNQ